jgi:glycosyltransferase involved in cell wall biosynthesis
VKSREDSLGSPDTIDILLATYNGEAYLTQQLESLFRQSYQNWRLLVRDDGSRDKTLSLLRSEAERHPGRIHIIEDTKGSLGATQNFGELLLYSTANYTMFCDQDDVWLPNKIELSLERMLQLEQRHGNTHPVLVYTDLQLVDETLSTIAPSFWSYSKADPRQRQTWNRLLIDNIAAGCTMLFNRALREIATPIAKEATVHDWWFALIASLVGVIEPLHEPTILYRQHQSNTIGISRNPGRKLNTLLSNNAVHTLRTKLKESQRQVGAIIKQCESSLDARTLHLLETFSRLDTLNPIQRRLFLLHHSILRVGFVKNLGLLLRM